MLRCWLVFGCIFWCTLVFSQELVKDINATPKSQIINGSTAQYCFPCGSFVFFSATDRAHGRELWRTDGTPGGTIMLSDIFGPNDGMYDPRVVCVNNKAYFINEGIWESDGTPGGTQMTFPAPWTVVIPQHFGRFGNELVVAVDNQLYITTGQISGAPVLIKQFDAIPNTTAGIGDFVQSGNKLFVQVTHAEPFSSGPNHSELWTYDGSTFTLLSSLDQQSFLFLNMVAFDNMVAYIAEDPDHGKEIWISDGTVAGTRILYDMTPGPTGSSAAIIGAAENQLIFVSFDNWGTWAYDITSGSTRKIIDSFVARDLTERNGGVYLIGLGVSDAQLVRTDADFENAQVLIQQMHTTYPYLSSAGEKLIFPLDGELGVLDPTTDSYSVVKDIHTGPNASNATSFAATSTKSIFLADDGPHGFEPWVSDGTNAGTMLLKDIAEGTGSISFFDIYRHDKRLYFLTNTTEDTYARSLWTTDGSTTGTYSIPVPGNSSPTYPFAGIDDYILTFSNWRMNKTDVTTGVTTVLKDLLPDYNQFAGEAGFMRLGDEVFFPLMAVKRSGEIEGMELWKANPYTNEMSQVKDISPGPGSSYSFDLLRHSALSNKLIFNAVTPDAGEEPWVTDGTEAGTIILKDINLAGNSEARNFTTVGDKVYFQATSVSDGTELWVTDGTPQGTHIVVDLFPGTGNGIRDGTWAALNGKIYFAGTVDGISTNIYSTDGTATNTQVFKNIASQGWSTPGSFVASAAKFYFTAWSSSQALQLWMSDGTPAGTTVVELQPGYQSIYPVNLVADDDGAVYFAGTDGIWGTKGTPETTKFLGAALPTSILYLTENYVLFTQRSGTYGSELFRVNKSDRTGQTISFSGFDHLQIGHEYPVQVTASSGLPVSLVSSDPSTIEVVDDKIRVHKAGEVTFTATQIGNSDFSPVTKTLHVNVPKLNQAITFPEIGTKTITDPPFNANATASSGLPIGYSSLDETVATISANGLVTIHSSGFTSITADQSGNENYNPAASPVVRVLFVDKASQTINTTPFGTKIASDPPFQAVASASSGLPLSFSSTDETVATVSSTGVVTIKKAGQTIVGFSQAGNDIYKPATAQLILNVGKLNQSITFAALNVKTFNDAPYFVHATSSSGLAIVFVSDNTLIAQVTQDGEVTLVGAGVTQITAMQSGDDNYNTATPVMRDLVVKKANQTITFDPLPPVLASDDDFFVEAETSSGLPVVFTSSNEGVAKISSDGKISIEGVGTTAITAIQLGNNNYNPAPSAARNLVVKGQKQAITLIPVNDKIATDDPFFVNGFSSSGLPLTFASFDPTIASITANGLVTMHASGIVTIVATQTGDDVYGPADQVITTFKVSKASQSITFPTIFSVADGSGPFGLNASASSGLPIVYKSLASAEARVTFNGNIATTSGVGHANIVATQPGNAKYNPAEDVQIIFCVNPRKPEISVTQTAERATLQSSAEINNTWTLNGDPLAVTTRAITVTKDGIYKVATSMFNCKSEYSQGANIVITGMEESNEISLFPNPADKMLVLRCNSPSSIQLTDTFGRTHLDQKIATPETQIDVSALVAGVYFVIVTNGSQTHYLKFVKR